MHTPKVRSIERISQPHRTYYVDNVGMTLLSERLKIAMAETSPPMRATDLCKAIGVSKATLSDWLSGKTREMKSSYLIKASKVLKVTPEWLATGSAPMRPPKNHINEPTSGYSVQTNPNAPINIDQSGVPPEVVMRIMRMITKGVGQERFGRYQESEQKRIINLLQTAILDKESEGLSDKFILKMAGIK